MNLRPVWLEWPETQTLIAAFGAASQPLRFVGGAVRDALLERKVTDVDAATPATPDAVMVLLGAAQIKAIPTGIAHGTVTARIGTRQFEITTLRKDVACDGRHAQVAYTSAWEEDAARRDFTLNAMYLSPQGELFDYFGGEADARAGRIRFIGEAQQRIEEDALRILRFFRFHASHGKPEADEVALSACREKRAMLEGLSGERIQQEMLKLLAAPGPRDALMLMQQAGVAELVFGAAIEPQRLDVWQSETATHQPLLRLSRLLRGSTVTANAIATRWRLSGQQKQTLHAWMQPEPVSDERAVKALIRRVGSSSAEGQVWLAIAEGALSKVQAAQWVNLCRTWQPPIFPVTGSDLQAAGVASGPVMGEALRRLEALWEDSDYALSKQELLARL